MQLPLRLLVLLVLEQVLPEILLGPTSQGLALARRRHAS